MIPSRKKYVDERTEIRRKKWREYNESHKEKRIAYRHKV